MPIYQYGEVIAVREPVPDDRGCVIHERIVASDDGIKILTIDGDEIPRDNVQRYVRRMTEYQVFDLQQRQMLQQVPPEFHVALSKLAWDEGHSSGHREVLNCLVELIALLEKPIKDYADRVTDETIKTTKSRRKS